MSKPNLIIEGSLIHLSIFEPLMEKYQLIVVDMEVANYVKSMGLDIISAMEQVDDHFFTALRNHGFWLVKRILEKIETNELVLDPDNKYMHGEELGHWMPLFTYDKFLSTMAVLAGVDISYGKYGAEGILLHEDVTAMGRALAQYGKAQGIPVLHLAHANHFLEPNTSDMHCKISSDYIGAAGSYMKDWYKQCGGEDDKITLVGNPLWDHYYDESLAPTKAQSRKMFGLGDEDLVIAFGTTWPQMVSVGGSAWEKSIAILDETWHRMCEAAKNLNAKLIVKIHPTGGDGRAEMYHEYMKENDVKGLITRSFNPQCLRASDCTVVQTSSNLAIESIINDTPAVELYAPGARIPGLDGTWGDDLEDVILKAIEDGPKKELVREMNYDDDGRAVDRVVEWVRKIC